MFVLAFLLEEKASNTSSMELVRLLLAGTARGYFGGSCPVRSAGWEAAAWRK